MEYAKGLTKLRNTDLSKLPGGHLSHDQVAGRIRLLYPSDADHELVCTMARDRIAWLAWRVSVLEVQLQRAQEMGQVLDELLQGNDRRCRECWGYLGKHDEGCKAVRGSQALAAFNDSLIEARSE